MEVGAVSILICTKNRIIEVRRLVRLLSERKVRFLGETIKPELVVVEDVSNFSPGQTPTAIEGVKYIYVAQPACGFGAIRQLAVKASQGDIMVFIDDDCLPCEDWPNSLLEEFSDPRVSSAGGGFLPQEGNSISYAISLIGFPAGGLPRLISCGKEIRESPLLSTGNLALRRSAVQSAGGFDSQHHYGGEDTKLVEKLSGKKLFVPNALVSHRNRDNFLDVWGWFIRRGMGEYRINRQMGRGIFMALFHPIRWSWSWRLLGLFCFFLVLGWKGVFLFFSLYFTFLFLKIFKENHKASSLPAVEEKRKICFRARPLLIAPLLRLWMDIAREVGRFRAMIEEIS